MSMLYRDYKVGYRRHSSKVYLSGNFSYATCHNFVYEIHQIKIFFTLGNIVQVRSVNNCVIACSCLEMTEKEINAKYANYYYTVQYQNNIIKAHTVSAWSLVCRSI